MNAINLIVTDCDRHQLRKAQQAVAAALAHAADLQLCRVVVLAVDADFDVVRAAFADAAPLVSVDTMTNINKYKGTAQ